MKKISLPIIIGVAILLIIILSFGLPFQVVDTGNVGIVTRFGQLTGRVLEPGLSWKTPFIDKVIIFNTRTVKDEVNARAATKDLQDVNADVVIVYHVDRENVEHLYTTVGTEDHVKEVILQPLIQETLKQTTAKFTAEELITKRAEVKTQVDELMIEKLQNYNLVLEEIAITNFEFSIQFASAVEAKQIAEQRAKQAAFELEQAKKEVETYKLQAASLNDYTLRKLFIEKWDGHLPTTVTETYLTKTLPENATKR